MILSIITINYNNSEGLKKTLESIKRINFEYELIIVDGKSIDDSIKIAKSFENTTSKFKLITEKDNGIYDAMNKGVKSANGDWVIFMNSGDCFNFTKNIYQILKKHSNYALIYGNNLMYGKIDCPLSIKALERGIIHACHQSMFFNYKLLSEELRYKILYKIYADYELVNRLYLKKYKFIYINECFSESEPGGISQKRTIRKRVDKFLIILRSYGILGIVRSYFK